MIPRKINRLVLTLAGAPAIVSSAHAAITVDWLALASGGTPASFRLTNDQGATRATGSLLLPSGAFADTPAALPLSSASWVGGTPQMTDSLLGNATVTGTEFFAINGDTSPLSYDIRLTVTSGDTLYLAIGGIFHETTSVTLTTSVPGAMISLVETVDWQSDFAAYTDSLDWNGSVLSPVSAAIAESAVAFFQITNLSGADPYINLSFTGSSGPTFGGDPVFVAIGMPPIPEPSALTLAGLGGLMLLRRHRRPV